MSVMCISAAMGSVVLHCALLVLLSGSCQALVSGEDFAFSYLQTYKPTWSAPSIRLHITAVQSDVKVSVAVPFLEFWKEKNVEAGKTVTINLPRDVRIFGNKGIAQTIRLNSTGPVTITTSMCRRYMTDITSILPISEWGTEYFLITPSGSQLTSYKKFSVTNGKEPNEITITMTCSLAYQGSEHEIGKPIKIFLGPYESVQFKTKDIVAGSQIKSKKPVAVFLGNTCPSRHQCNQVFKQLLPVSKWGTRFIVPNLRFHQKFDCIFVLASQKTKVTVQSSEGKEVIILNKGEIKKIDNRGQLNFVVEADHPIQLFIFFKRIRRHGVYAEPFYVNIVPNDHLCLSYLLHNLKGFHTKVLFMVKTNETSLIEVDGVELKHVRWREGRGTDYSFALAVVRSRSNGTSTVVSSKGDAFSVYNIGLTLKNGFSIPGQCLKPDISCKNVRCSAGHVCKMIDGVPKCVPEPTELTTCYAMGDPHYRTFDGQRFDFMGTCTYVMAKSCAVWGSLPTFEVLAQNENRGNRRVSYVGLVVVTVYGTTITVVNSENGFVRIDNTAWGLPITINGGKLQIFQSGRSVVIETDFGLHVRYDWHHSLVVGLPSSYKEKTCGLCGNFNGNPSDDFATPSGSQAGSVVDFFSSWKVPGPIDDAHCRDDCVGGCQNKCEHKLLDIWRGNSFCGIITMAGKNGPFSQCHSVVDPEVYFVGCTFDVCIGLGQRLYLCKALEAYADACQSAGVEVYDWRTIARCPAKCPRNSHYELCGSACPATCSDPDAPSKCRRPCIESCTCNNGFMWSGKQCVPEKQCGCIYNGRYVPAGKSFWADEGCGRWCTCDPKNREVRCIDKGCKSGQKCQVKDGIRQCVAVSFKFCYGVGDPHYKTFDGTKFDFQGTCVYRLAALCSKDTDLEPFEVNVQNENRGNKVVAYTKLVEVKIYSLSIVISRTHKGLVMVNNEFVNLPISLQDGDVRVHKSGWYAVISTNFGLRVAYNWKGAVFVILTSDYKGAVCGLCGNYNDRPQDDLIPKNGNEPVEPADFGASWRVAEIPGCLDACEGKCPDCDITEKNKYESNDYCGIIKDPRGPFRDCHAQVDPANAFEDCVFDVCMYKGIKDVLCQAITAYTSACQDVGAEVYSWRTERFCPIKCPAYSHYEVCAAACPATCPSMAPPRGCHVPCMEDCVCDEGYILSGGICVPLSHCGCEHEDRYYQIGEVFFPDGKCDEECKCVFEETTKVICKQFHCGPNEKCAVENGVRKCHPVGEGVCRVSGHHHYTTFDGKKYDFHGTCAYVLSQTYDIKGTHLTQYGVHVHKEWSRNRTVSVIKLVDVRVSGKSIIMKRNTVGVLVNGIFNNLPININQGAVLIFKEGTNYVIETDFGLRVSYDLRYSVVVTVPGNYRDKVCGLCGTFNGNPGDDFFLRSRGFTTDVNDFALSWKLNIPNVLCSNGCEGNQCPVCDKAHKAVFSKYAYCGILKAPKGPFASCHSILDPKPFFDDCVFDVCAANGDESVHCDSIAAYAFSCQKAGVNIKIWRSPFFCPMKCPANSHYEVCSDLNCVACLGLAELVPFNIGCREGCECDTGFVFNGETCVEEDECGCSDGQRTYKPGQVFYNEDCSKKCVCDPVKGLVCEDHSCPRGTTCSVKKGIVGCYDKDPCKNANCRLKEKCVVEKDEAVCVPTFTGVCRACGDPHYITFDDFKYDFQGTCQYVISETCGNLDGLVPFSITERNDNRGNRAVSYVADVEVSVYGYSIIVHKNQVGKVTVDGLIYNLPVFLGEDSLVSISQQGHQIKIETVFGLIVTYGWNHGLIIKLPSSYYNLVCGLCGNFNGDKSDEIQNPAGESLSNVVDWARSWRTPNQEDKKCSDTCQHNCPTCDDKQRKVYETEDFCGALTAKHNNVFEICHEKVDPKPFLDSCVFDMCMNKGDKKILCQTLASYTQQCREEGVQINGWRRKFGCPMNCQPHSHFEECASPCQPTCPFLEQKQICATVCVETCVCDKGYVLSAGVCVPEATCGCWYQGSYYKPGQRFWEGPGCERLCVCDTTLGMVVCDAASCSDNEECSVVDWIRACRPKRYATCTGAGNLHYTTFDGRRFDFQGTCKYQLAALCVKNPYLQPFNVTVQNENRGNNLAVSITRTVTIEIYGVTIIISRENHNEIELDGQHKDLPLQYSDDLWVSHSGQKAVVETAAGITITFDWHHRVSVTLPNTYHGAVCGLCGNYNGNPNDDFNKPNGQAADTEVQLGRSWRVGIVQGCLSVCQGPRCSRCDGSQKDVFKIKKYCGIIADKRGPFKKCHSRIDNAPYLEDCAFDACQYDGHYGSVCDAIEAYVSACQSAGVEVRPWRTDKFCPMLCPANSHYSLCATSCPATCAIFTQRNCNKPCAETCECDNGFLLSGGACVPIKDCGCSYGGHYYQSGAVFYPDDKCLKKCVCRENGAILCQRTRCRHGEECKLVDGVRGCHPVKEAKCVASGGSHYQTFDGRRFDFQGTCVYILAKVHDDDEGQLTSFNVTQGKWGNGNVAVTKSVGVEVYGFVIYIQRGDSWKVKVNGEIVNLPSSLHDDRIQITQEGRNIIVRTDFGLRVQYDTVYYVEVIVPSTYWQKMFGLCGNYNKKPDDDFLLPNGKFTDDVDVFGKSWAVDLLGFECGGCGSHCPVCDPIKAAELGKPDSCGIIDAYDGPFKVCHSRINPIRYFSDCVFDVCEDKDALCDSIMAYALACQSAGVQIQQWRNNSFCPASCPKNSHYELCADTCGGSCVGLLRAVSCSENCFEGCQCDQGLVFDGDQCVSPGKCGCLHNDRYLKVGESVVDPQCQSTCVCKAPGIVKCENKLCSSSEVCEVRDGVRDCHPTQGQCSIDKAAHLATFDGLTGSMGDLGAFEVASLCDFTDARWFRVVVDVRRCGRASFVVDAVYVFFKNYSIAVNSQQEVWVNGRKTFLPVRLGCNVSVHVSENKVVVERTSVVSITFSLSREVVVTVDPSLTYKMCGACGNFNHDPKDDLTTADGETAMDLVKMVWSWFAGDFSRCGL